jgi:formamidopyrimidine-DNA glycosylase
MTIYTFITQVSKVSIMPELPEVELLCRTLAPNLTGATLGTLIIHQPQLRYPLPEKILRQCQEQRIIRLFRRSKYMLCQLENTAHLLIHLGMTGKSFIEPKSYISQKHDHWLWPITQSKSGTDEELLWIYNDARRFGLLLALNEGMLPEQHPLLKKLGMEPLDEFFSFDLFAKGCSSKAIPIKQRLMDPSFVVGIGNIYASEILFRAAIHPYRSANNLSLLEQERLFFAIPAILNEAINAGGSTIKDYVSRRGVAGEYQQQFAVYGKKNKPCSKCQGLIFHNQWQGRSTYWCPNCQLEL